MRVKAARCRGEGRGQRGSQGGQASSRETGGERGRGEEPPGGDGGEGMEGEGGRWREGGSTWRATWRLAPGDPFPGVLSAPGRSGWRSYCKLDLIGADSPLNGCSAGYKR